MKKEIERLERERGCSKLPFSFFSILKQNSIII